MDTERRFFFKKYSEEHEERIIKNKIESDKLQSLKRKSPKDTCAIYDYP